MTTYEWAAYFDAVGRCGQRSCTNCKGSYPNLYNPHDTCPYNVIRLRNRNTFLKVSQALQNIGANIDITEDELAALLRDEGVT